MASTLPSVRARIAGIDYALPERALRNDELSAAHPAWKLEEVAKRTGVLERRIASAEQTALDLGEVASRQLLDRLGVPPSEVEALVFCTQTPDHLMPPNACLLQSRLGLSMSTIAFDITLACSGFVYGLMIAKSLIESGGSRNVLLVTGDTYSRLINPGDRATVSLFGDGAAATYIRRDQVGLEAFALGTDGSRASCFIVPAGGARLPYSNETSASQLDRSGNVRTLENIHMDGQAILAFVKREVPDSVSSLLERTGTRRDAIDLVILHQASQTATEYLQQALEIPAARFFSNIARVGNTVSASIPIALRDAEIAGALLPGATVLVVGFGVGLSWGSGLLTW